MWKRERKRGHMLLARSLTFLALYGFVEKGKTLPSLTLVLQRGGRRGRSRGQGRGRGRPPKIPAAGEVTKK